MSSAILPVKKTTEKEQTCVGLWSATDKHACMHRPQESLGLYSTMHGMGFTPPTRHLYAGNTSDEYIFNTGKSSLVDVTLGPEFASHLHHVSGVFACAIVCAGELVLC